jgi:hypothetical protein
MKKLIVGLSILCFVHLLNIAGFAADGDPVLEGKMATGNIMTTGHLGVGDVPAYPLDITMTATDTYGINIEGAAADYTGADATIGMVINRDVNRGTGAINNYAGWQSYVTVKHTDATIAGDLFLYGNITRAQNDGASLTIEDASDRQYWEVGVHSTVKDEGVYDTDAAGNFVVRFIGYYAYVWADTYDVFDTSTTSPANIFSAMGIDIKVEHVPTLNGTATGTFNSYGVYVGEVSGDTAGTSSAYGIYIADAVSGADTNYAFYSADADASYFAGNITSNLNLAGATYGSDATISDADLLSIDDGATTTIAVGGGVGSPIVWTTATGTGAPARADSPTFTTAVGLTSGNLTLGNGNLVPSTAGKGVAFVTATNAGRVTNLTLSGGGTGYTTGTLIFTGGDGTGAAGTFVAAAGIITSVTITNSGSGYTTAPTVDGDAGGNADAVIVVHLAARTAGLLTPYEEGTWMPGVSFGNNSVGVTYSGNTVGYYTRIGRLVTAGGMVQLTSKGTSNGTAAIIGLPYLSIDANNSRAAAALGNINAISFADQLQGYITRNNSKIFLAETTNAGVLTEITDGNFANDSYIYVSITYCAQ